MCAPATKVAACLKAGQALSCIWNSLYFLILTSFSSSNGGASCAASEHLLQGIFFQGHLAEFYYVLNSVVVEVTQSLKYRGVISVSDPKEGLSLALAKKRRK